MESFPRNIKKFIFSPGFGFLMILVYLSFINFFVIKSTPEIIFLQFALLVLIFKRFRTGSFFKTWIPFIALFVFYEFLRGWADDLAPFYDGTLRVVYELEKDIFGTLPTITLQRIFPSSHWVVQLSLFFYSVFFYYSFLVAFIVWLRDEKKFKSYFGRFLALTYVSLFVFFIFPTAPPWFMAKELDLPLSRYLMDTNILQAFAYLDIYRYFVRGNEVAALPSLHMAWPMFSTLFLVKNFKNKFLYLLFVIPAMIGFSIVLTGEHYVIDVLLGTLFAVLAVFVFEKQGKSKEINL